MALNVKILKIVTGEDIIAEVISETEKFIKIKNPLRVVMMPSKADPKSPTIAFIPWVDFYTEKEFTLDKSHVLVIGSAIKEFINQYNSVFGGIVSPTSSKLVIPGS